MQNNHLCTRKYVKKRLWASQSELPSSQTHDLTPRILPRYRDSCQNTNLVNTKRDKSRVALQLDDLSSAVKVVRESMEGVPDPSPGEALDPEKHFDWVGGGVACACLLVDQFLCCFSYDGHSSVGAAAAAGATTCFAGPSPGPSISGHANQSFASSE